MREGFSQTPLLKVERSQRRERPFHWLQLASCNGGSALDLNGLLAISKPLPKANDMTFWDSDIFKSHFTYVPKVHRNNQKHSTSSQFSSSPPSGQLPWSGAHGVAFGEAEPHKNDKVLNSGDQRQRSTTFSH